MSDVIRVLLAGLAGMAMACLCIWLAFWLRERRADRAHRERMAVLREHYALLRERFTPPEIVP